MHKSKVLHQAMMQSSRSADAKSLPFFCVHEILLERSFDRETPAVFGRIFSSVLMMMASPISAAHSPLPSSTGAPLLRVANGTLDHVFSIPFTGNPVVVSMINGLESPTFARTSDGGGIKIVLDDAGLFPSKVTAVDVIKNAGVDASQVIDPLRPPSTMPHRPGYRLVSTFRVPGRNSYLAAWRKLRSDESSLTFETESGQAGKPTLVATSSSPILGAAVQLSVHSPDLTIAVWSKGSAAGDVVVGTYRWTDRGR